MICGLCHRTSSEYNTYFMQIAFGNATVLMMCGDCILEKIGVENKAELTSLLRHLSEGASINEPTFRLKFIDNDRYGNYFSFYLQESIFYRFFGKDLLPPVVPF